MHLYATFHEKGCAFEAWIPGNDGEPVAFQVRILAGARLKYTLLCLWCASPSWASISTPWRALKPSRTGSSRSSRRRWRSRAGTTAALDALEVEVGGECLREHRARRQPWADPPVGEFERVEDLFVRKFGALPGGREAAGHWMRTKRPGFRDRTLAEALHLGMVNDVLMLLRDRP